MRPSRGFRAKGARYFRCQVLDVREALDGHEAVHTHGLWIAKTVHVIARQVDQLDVFSAVLDRRMQLFC